jgi:DNA mismatch repair protein MutS2
MVERKHLELLQFDKIVNLIRQKCHSEQARNLCDSLAPQNYSDQIQKELTRTEELKMVLTGSGFFPSVEHDDILDELNYLGRDGALLHEEQLLSVLKTLETANTLIRFVKGKRQLLPELSGLAAHLQVFENVVSDITRVIDNEGQVKDNASPELQRIRKQISEQRRESDKRFYNYISQLRKHGYLRENEESFFNGRRTLAVLVEHKSDVPGFVHGKSESGKTIFIEPGVTMAINNDIAELEIDERREVNRILRELCNAIRPFVPEILQSVEFLIYTDFLKAKALFAVDLFANLPRLKPTFELKINEAVHPLLFLQNKRVGKKTVPLTIELNKEQRILVISGPNAGGKTIALKTVGLLQIMLQSGLLIPVQENSEYCFFEKILIDIGDTQSIENELSTYSAKLKSMTSILNEINEGTLVLMDEFGSGTDPELGSAIAEAVLESLVTSQTKGIITSHFGDVKLLADKLPGAVNGSMLFDLDTLDPKYILSVGEPGSSYTFEVAERIGFPKHLIQRAREKVNKDKLKLNRLLSEVQDQKAKLVTQQQNLEHEAFLQKMAKEKYHTLFNKWEEKIHKERERKIELSRLADYGQKYLRLMADWNEKKDRKEVIKRFIDGITAESKKQELLRKQKKHDSYAEKKIARIKPVLKIGSKVKILNGSEVGVVEEIKEEKVFIKFGLMKMTVGMQNLVLAED